MEIQRYVNGKAIGPEELGTLRMTTPELIGAVRAARRRAGGEEKRILGDRGEVRAVANRTVTEGVAVKGGR